MSTTLKARTTSVTLFQGDDLDKIRAEQAKVEAATAAAMNLSDKPLRLNDSSEVQEAVKAFDEFMDECVARGVTIELQAVGRKVYRDLLAKHPPRKVTVKDEDGEREDTHPDDEGWGFNYESLADDLVPACVVDKAAFDEAFLDNLADGDWSKLYSAAVLLNQGAGPDPTLRLRSRLGPISDEISASPARSA